jgi:hypothetical protein
MGDYPHRYAATDISFDRSRIHPRDIFRVDDRFQVHGTQTKHHGRIGRIDSIGDRRLSVTFDDGLSGQFVEYTDAVLIPKSGAATIPTPTRLQIPVRSNTAPRNPRAARNTDSHATARGSTVDDDFTSRNHRAAANEGYRTLSAVHAHSPSDVGQHHAFDGTAMRHVSVPMTERQSRRSVTRLMSRNILDAAWRQPNGADTSDNMGTQDSEHLDDDYSILQHDDDTHDVRSTPTVATSLATDRILDQFSITAATLIVQSETEHDMEQLLQRFI